ncbi:hydrolase [Segnochrobactraceae bacterium EtOH-i3]
MVRRAPEPPRAWQRMLSGRRLDLLDPSPLDIEIGDIAHGLARVARWNGQTVGDHAFSVAQHSLLVEAILRHMVPAAGPTEALAALLHDASEYVVGDLISPFKAVVGPPYKTLELRILTAILLRFGLPAQPDPALEKAVKAADGLSAWLEAVHLAGFSRDEADQIFGRPKGRAAGFAPGALIEPWPTAEAQARFLARFAALDDERRPSPALAPGP